MPDNNIAFSGSVPENYERYLGPYFFEPYAREVATRIHGKPAQVLEIAAGTGRVTAHLRQTIPASARLVATDLNPDMITIAKRLVPSDQIEWQTANAQELPFGDECFDLVVCQFGLMFVPDKPKALSEAFRVLKPGGQFLLSTWDRQEYNRATYVAEQVVHRHFPSDPPMFFRVPFSLHDPDQLLSLLETAGFNNIQIDNVSLPGVSASAHDAATGMIEGSPMYGAIQQRDAELIPLIKEELVAALSGEFGEAPMTSPQRAWLISAEK